MFACGLRNLVLVNLLHGKCKFMGEGVLLHWGPPLEKEKHLLPSPQSAVFLCFVLGFAIVFNHFGSRRHNFNVFYFCLFHVRGVRTNLQFKPVVAFCGVLALRYAINMNFILWTLEFCMPVVYYPMGAIGCLSGSVICIRLWMQITAHNSRILSQFLILQDSCKSRLGYLGYFKNSSF